MTLDSGTPAVAAVSDMDESRWGFHQSPKLKDGAVPAKGTSHLMASRDNGRSFQHRSTIAADIAGRFSGDGGRTWSSEDRILVPNEGVCNVMSASLLRLQDGRIALFYARKNSFKDSRLYLRTSADEAETWRTVGNIETDPDRGFCYTAIHFVDDAILLAYCCGGGKSAVLQDCCIRRFEKVWVS